MCIILHELLKYYVYITSRFVAQKQVFCSNGCRYVDNKVCNPTQKLKAQHLFL